MWIWLALLFWQLLRGTIRQDCLQKWPFSLVELFMDLLFLLAPSDFIIAPRDCSHGREWDTWETLTCPWGILTLCFAQCSLYYPPFLLCYHMQTNWLHPHKLQQMSVHFRSRCLFYRTWCIAPHQGFPSYSRNWPSSIQYEASLHLHMSFCHPTPCKWCKRWRLAQALLQCRGGWHSWTANTS